MNKSIEEIYAKEGESLQELLQTWIDENNSYIYCISLQKDVKCRCR